MYFNMHILNFYTLFQELHNLKPDSIVQTNIVVEIIKTNVV